ncbi:MAG: transporter [Bacteroides sp.]|nr:transporter [Bacteroides sp.]MCM1086099.1 transporter [Bacteroides sp.]
MNLNGILRFVKNWALLLALLIGCLGHSFFIAYADKTVYLIFAMLLFTFCRIDPSQLRFRKVHLVFLSIQLFGSMGLYYLFNAFGWNNLAESSMMCILTPTAAASAVVTMKLGGDGASNTTYVLLSSLLISFVAPLWFPFLHESAGGIPFWVACWGILKRVLPLLAGPFLLAMLLKYAAPRVHDSFARWHEVSFYLWASCLVFAAAQMADAILRSHVGGLTLFMLAAGSAVLCGLMFFLGKRLGRHYGDSISGGQSLGQKNMVLGIWVAGMFLTPASGATPLAIVGMGTYIIWQNIINSCQLYLKRRQDSGIGES